jgi:23S rRNA (adenine2503-C2)-methyltransferase
VSVAPRAHEVDPRPRLAGLDREALARILHARTGVALARARRVAGRALGAAFAGFRDDGVAWDAPDLAHAGVGSWAHPTLLGLTPQLSLELVDRAPSTDGTVRLLLRARDGALVESVVIPAEAGRDRARTTLCISSQVGCARACRFCETGSLGLVRQLAAEEIVDQVRIGWRICSEAGRPVDRRSQLCWAECTPRGTPAASPVEPVSTPPPRRIKGRERVVSNIVFMGMGEPFDNLREVARAISLITDTSAFDFPATRITVSTVGVADRFAEFFRLTRAELAVSLGAPDDARRSALMPINERFDLATLRALLLAALPPGRRVLFQYVLFAGVNDSLADADALAVYLRGVPCRLNVIPANPGPDASLVAPTDARVSAFAERVRARGIVALVRRPRGRDVGGACGQLAGARRSALLRAPARNEPPEAPCPA